MIEKKEFSTRFEILRGATAEGEGEFLGSAKLIDEYVKKQARSIYTQQHPNERKLNKVSDLDIIKNQLVNQKSPQYLALENKEYKKRSLGSLLYCKFVIEETLEQLYQPGAVEKFELDSTQWTNLEKDSGVREKLDDKQLLYLLQDTLGKLYAVGDDAPMQLNRLFLIANELQKRDINPEMDLELANRVNLSIYTMLRIVQIRLDSLSVFERPAAGLNGINLDNVQKSLKDITDTTETKYKKIDSKLQLEKKKEQGSEDTAQSYLNKQIVATYDNAVSNNQNPHKALEEKFSSIVKGIHSVIEPKKRLGALETKKSLVNELIDALKDPKGKKYEDIIKKHNSAFNIIMMISNESNGTNKWKDLNELEESKSTLYQQSINLVTSPFWDNNDYRSKSHLLGVAENSMHILETRIETEGKHIEDSCGKLAGGDEKLATALSEESVDELKKMHRGYKAAQEVFRLSAQLEDDTNTYEDIIKNNIDVRENNPIIYKIMKFLPNIIRKFISHDVNFLIEMEESKKELESLKQELNEVITNTPTHSTVGESVKITTPIDTSYYRQEVLTAKQNYMRMMKELKGAETSNEAEKQKPSDPDNTTSTPGV